MDAKDPRGAPAGAPPLTWETLLREHLGYLRGCVAAERIPQADREDVLQDVLHSVSRALITFDPSRGELRAWLNTIVRNHASRYRRRAYRRHERPWPDEPLEVADEAQSSEERRLEYERRQLLSALLLELPPERRQAVIAHELDEAGIQRVAEQLSIPATTAKSRVRLGREDLKAAARRWQARHHRRLAALLPVRAAGCSEEPSSYTAPLQHLLVRARRAFGGVMSGARGQRARAFAHACASLAASAWSVVVAAGLLLAGHGGLYPGGAAAPGPSQAARAHTSLMTALGGRANALSSSRVNNEPPSQGAMMAAKSEGSAPVRPRDMSRPRDTSWPQQRRPGAQGDAHELLRMAAAARAIGNDSLAHALLERRRLDISSGAPLPDRNESLASPTGIARDR